VGVTSAVVVVVVVVEVVEVVEVVFEEDLEERARLYRGACGACEEEAAEDDADDDAVVVVVVELSGSLARRFPGVNAVLEVVSDVAGGASNTSKRSIVCCCCDCM